MLHYNVLKKLNLELLTLSPRVFFEREGLRAKHLAPFAAFRDFNRFNMQHDHVLTKINFEFLTLGSGWSTGKIFPF